MLFILETATILAYMYNGTLGILCMCATVLFMVSRRTSFLNKILSLMILSLPMSYIGIGGMNMHQIYAWYYMSLILFLIYNAIYRGNTVRFSINTIIPLFVVVIDLLINLFWSNSLAKSIQESGQLLMMLVPLVDACNNKDHFSLELKEINDCFEVFLLSCLATSICTAIQYLVYRFMHVQIGILGFSGNNRVLYNCLFKGASILPIYLGIGFLYALLRMTYDGFKISLLLKSLLILVGMVLNSSRTGIAAVAVVSAFILIRYFLQHGSVRALLLGIIVAISVLYGMNYILSSRVRLSSFLDANGRNENFLHGIEVWTSNLRVFLIGEGFATDSFDLIAKPHNVLLQSLAQCGLIATIMLVYMFFVFYRSLYRSMYSPIFLFLIISGFLVTDFYANCFTTVIIILITIHSSYHNRDISRPRA